MKRLVTLDRALKDRKLLNLGADSWLTWRSAAKAAYAEQLSADELAAFHAVSGGRLPPRKKVKRFVSAASRRSAKSRMAAALMVYEAALVDHSDRLAPGEVGLCAAVSPTRGQARVILDYAVGFLKASPMLQELIVGEPMAEEVRLTNGNIIRTLTSDFRNLRGHTLLCACLDEASFLRDEDSKTSDIEAARSLEPALATTGGMICIFSSPYRKSGLLYNLHRDFFSESSDETLVIAGASVLFNPTIDTSVIAAAYESDPQAALSEWDGQFRPDIGDYLDDATIDRATDHGGALELPPREGLRYVAFTDASGGVGGDSYTLCIAHKVRSAGPAKQDDRFEIDVIRGTPRGRVFDPMTVTREYARLCKQFKVSKVTGDAYGKEWVAGAWRECGITYLPSTRTKNEIYLEALPAFTRGQVSLRPNETLLRELRLLERRTSRSGRDTVQHPPRGRDDYANAVCGAIALLMLDHTAPMLVTPEMVNELAMMNGGRRRAGDAGWRPDFS
jgi:hypothetical protein